MDSNDKKGASHWVTASPLYDQHTVLCKRDFWDALCLRYGWLPKGLPTTCACGGSFDVRHAFSCLHGGFRTLMHNRVTGIFAYFSNLAGIKNIALESLLQGLT